MHPTGRSAALCAATLPVALLPAVITPELWPVWLAALIALAVLHVVEGLRLPRGKDLSIELTLPTEVEIGRAATALVKLSSTRRDFVLQLTGDLDPELSPWEPTAVTVPAGGSKSVALPVLASRRGTFSVRALWVRSRSPLGLLARTSSVAVDRSVAIVPDVRTAREAAVQFFGSRQSQLGVRVERFLGEGSEFESLRSWVPGLDSRSVDWKASARHRRLLCRRFRAERNQQLILAIDCGHLMSEPLAGMPRLDHAVSRALALAWIGLRNGDRVGMFGFDASPRQFVAPQAGMRSFAAIRHGSAALDYSPTETNFALGVLELTRRLRRRSLCVVFTEFADAVTAELMLDHVLRLARRHVVLFVALRDPELDALESTEPTTALQLHRAVLARELTTERDTVLERLRRAGVHVIDCVPDQLTNQLLNRYLEIQRRELV